MSVHRQRWSALPVLAVLALVGLACTPAAGQPADLADHGTDEPPYNPPTNNNTIIDVYNRTATTTVFIQWKDGRPSNYKMYFRRANVPLSFGDNYFEIWTSYRAPNVARANTILQQIKAAIECPTPSDCPSGFPSRSVNEWVKQYIANVRGEGLSTIFSRPTECNGALPNSCPATDGRYGPNLINVPAVWERLPGVDSANPTVGVLVIDTGLLITHEEFRDNENLVPGVSIDLSTNTPAPITEAQNNGHGTHVAGTVFARWNNGGVPGMVGRARGAVCRSFVPTPDGPRAPDEAVVRCINHAIANNLDIINLSLGGAQGRPLPAGDITRLAYENFCRQGGIFAIAAGNDNVNIGAPNFVYPAFFANDLAATFPNCILTVAAVDANGVLSDFGPRPGGRAGTNFGTGVGVAAPGSNILSAGIQSNTALVQLSGTSMASPHVAGVMTLLWNAFPRLTGAQVVNCIRTTATRPATNSPNVPGQGRIDGGIVNANAAFDCLQALAGPNPGRFNCIPGGNKRPQVCLTAAQIGTVIPLGPGARLTACAVTRVPGRGRHLLQDDAVATASATEPDTFKNSPPVCGAFGDQVCISWRHSISSPFLSIRVTATDAGGASRSADIDITLLRQRTWRGNTRPGCVPA